MDLQIAPPVELPGMRHDTAEGGGIYTWRHLAKVRPYGKFLVGFGSMDFPKSTLLRPNGTPYSHDTRTVYAPGGGVNVDITRHVALRVDYESQFWPHFLGHATALTPNGLTVGATYSFSPFHKHGQRSLLE